MIHEPVLNLTGNAFRSHPCCVVSIRYRPISPFHCGNTGFQRKGFIPDRCAVSYLLENSSFAVAREKTILIRSEHLGRDKDSRDKRHSGGVRIACHGRVESQSVRKV
jgi:hypothetical protein